MTSINSCHELAHDNHLFNQIKLFTKTSQWGVTEISEPGDVGGYMSDLKIVIREQRWLQLLFLNN